MSTYPTNNPYFGSRMNDPELIVKSANRSYNIQFHPAAFGPNVIGDNFDKTILSGRVLFAQDANKEGCNSTAYPQYYPGTNIAVNGSCIAISFRATCLKAAQVLAAQAVGCKSHLLANCNPNPPSTCTLGRINSQATSTKANFLIPSMTIGYQDAMLLLDEFNKTVSANLTAYIPGSGAIQDRGEIDALIEISKAVSLDQSQTSYGTIELQSYYLNPVDPCVGGRVMGISCINGSIYMIDGIGITATGQFPNSIAKLRKLQVFGFDNANFVGTVTQLNLTSLKTFVCSKGAGGSYGITALFPSVASMPLLEVIMISGNYLTSLPYDINMLQNLKYFVASNNLLTKLPTLSSPQLVWYDVSGNNIEADLPDFSSKSFMFVSLGSNKIKSSNVTELFNNMPSLLHVDLKNNLLSGPVPNFRNCGLLEAIIISGNYFEGGFPTTWNKPTIQYIDASYNRITGPLKLLSTSLNYIDCSHNLMSEAYFTGAPYMGLVINYNLPKTTEVIKFGFNKFEGKWTTLSLVTFASLRQLYLQNNSIQGFPSGFFTDNPPQISTVDLSNNKLEGDFPSKFPTSTWQLMNFQGNPKFKPTNGNDLPAWMVQTEPFIKSGSFSCPRLIGNAAAITGLELTINLDPAYYNYKNCVCDRGFYKSAPNCENIPNIIQVNNTALTLTDSIYGSNRLTLGVDITWMFTTSLEVNAFYFNIGVNSQYFNQFDDIIELYAADSSLQGPRVISFRGTDPVPLSNIEVSGKQDAYVVLNNVASLVFRSRKISGSHFSVNYSISALCPEKYKYDVSSQKCQLLFEINSGIQSAIYAIISVFNLMLIIILVVIVKKRNSLIIRSSSFPFCASMLVFMVLLGVGSYFYAVYPSEGDFVCNIRPWLTAGPLVGILSAMLVKVDRIRRIFASKELIVQTITNAQLAQTMTIMLSIEFALLIGFTVSRMSQSVLKVGTGYTNNKLVAVCTSSDSNNGSDSFYAWLLIQFIYIALFLAVAVIIAWSVRKVPSAFNEAPSIASSLLSLMVLLIILIPLNYMVDDNPNALMLIRGLGQVLVTSVLALFFFGPKLYLILEGKDNDKTLSSLGSSSRSSISSNASSAQTAESVDVSATLNLIKVLHKTFTEALSGSTDTSDLSTARQSFISSAKFKGSDQISGYLIQIEDLIKSSNDMHTCV